MTQDGKKKLSKRDLFSDSTMSFGDHLEELRSCLFKAVFGLMIGFSIGLYFGTDVVKLIQDPLMTALTQYYQDQAEKRALNIAEKTDDEQPNLPWTTDQIKEMIKTRRMLPQEYYIFPDQLFVQKILDESTRGSASAGSPPVPAPPLVVDPPDTGPAESNTESDTEADSDATNPDGSPDAETVGAIPEEEPLQVILWRRIDDDPRIKVKSLNPHEAFVIYIKASLMFGLLLASPWIFYQIWSFVASGLYPHERRYIHIFLPVSLFLFLFGAVGAFVLVFGPVLKFLFMFNEKMAIDPDPRISEWLSFVMILPLGFGISFQLPLVMLFLERIRVFTVEMYLSKWKVAILVIAIISMFLTPADPYSMLLMCVPLTILYFFGILLCKFMPRIRKPHEVYEDDEDFD